MQAVVIDEFGEPKDVLGTREVPAPEPGPGEVRIATILSPIHNHDLAIIRGVYGYRPPLPATPGTEAVGVVDAVGAGVTGPEVGQRVAVAARGRPGPTSSWPAPTRSSRCRRACPTRPPASCWPCR